MLIILLQAFLQMFETVGNEVQPMLWIHDVVGSNNQSPPQRWINWPVKTTVRSSPAGRKPGPVKVIIGDTIIILWLTVESLQSSEVVILYINWDILVFYSGDCAVMEMVQYCNV